MRTALIVTGVALATALLVAFLSFRRPSGTAGAAAPSASAKLVMPPIGVELHTVQPESLEIAITATGSLRARESVELVSELSRRLIRVRAVEGASVTKGAVLFELDVADTRAELARLEVQTRVAQTTLDRQKKLLAEGLSTAIELEAAQGRVDELHAERKLREVTLSKAQIRAPFSGTIGLRHVSEGAWVSPTTPLVTLQDTRTLKLDFTLPERYASLIRKDQTFRFSVEGRPTQENGVVRAFEPAIDTSSRSVIVRGEVSNVNDLLPGTFARVELPLRLEQALLVPAIAVVPGSDARRVYVERSGLARAVSVEVGARTNDRIQILKGLSPGDRVIVSNLLRLKDGARVRPAAAKAGP